MIRLFTTPLPSPTASNCYRPLLPLTVAFALGIAGRTVLPDREGWVLALLIASLVWTGWQFYTRRRSFGAPLLLSETAVADPGAARFAWDIVIERGAEPAGEPMELELARAGTGLRFHFEQRRNLRM